MLMNIGVIIGCFLMIISVIAINIVLWKGYLVGKKIKEKTYQLGKDLTDEKVENYIKYIDSVEVPPRRYHWDMLKSGYEIVKTNKDIDIRLAEQLRITILSKGILIK